MTVGVFFISLISATTPATSLILKELPLENEALVWGLARAIGGVPDQLNTGDKGVLLQNYTIKVKAGDRNHELMLEDQVHLTLTTLSLLERQARCRNVQDSEIIVQKEITLEAVKVRYNPQR
jgi:hypothetical protein